MRWSESNKTRSCNEIRPRPGCSKPAIHLSNMVFPAPDGPRMLSGVANALNATLSWKSGSCFSTCTSSAISTRHPASTPEPLRARPVIEAAQKSQRNYDVYCAPHEGTLHFVGFHCEINGDRNRLGSAGDVSRNHQRGAEFPKRARKRKHRAGEDPRPCQRQRDFLEHAPIRC